jgi:hypothetical protein
LSVLVELTSLSEVPLADVWPEAPVEEPAPSVSPEARGL